MQKFYFFSFQVSRRTWILHRQNPGTSTPVPLLSSLVTGIPQHGLDPLHSLCLHPLLNVFNVAVERREIQIWLPAPDSRAGLHAHSSLERSTVQKHQIWVTVQQEAWNLNNILSPESGHVLAQKWRQHMLKARVRKNKCIESFPSSTFPASRLSSSIYACIMVCDVICTLGFTSTFGFHSSLPREEQHLIYTQYDRGT